MREGKTIFGREWLARWREHLAAHRAAHHLRHLEHHGRCGGEFAEGHWGWHAMRGGRHRHGHGGGFFGGGPGGFDSEGGGMPRARKFSSDDLQLMLLALLAEQPAHGYELIKALEARSNGFYAPSPGMVYPALTYLEEIGHATVEQTGNRKCYSIADAGRSYLAANREQAELMLARLVHIGRKMDMVRRAFAGEPAEGEPEAGGWLQELISARRALKHALVLRTEAGPDEQRRIAAILARATAEIEAGTSKEGERDGE
ncbi:Transcriptional regulator PadR-like family protein [Andreprevotia lacus DSM 23236]|uniref:Transcriptional regulator PadR-like family protein n=1 Tax=Andreprevotia lacus DSM 23236 TaxID=1121001 RepID=A0A1W1XQD4_9NEIS|nr:PadR family transcriptional regulator [Andreprevotia lacus]SMC26084.1 Transcriptional regulator PadR-like family protein [Andreprevotia lacus DSM 23236]